MEVKVQIRLILMSNKEYNVHIWHINRLAKCVGACVWLEKIMSASGALELGI